MLKNFYGNLFIRIFDGLNLLILIVFSTHITISLKNKIILGGILLLTIGVSIATFFLFQKQQRIKKETEFLLLTQDFVHLLNLGVNEQLQTLTALKAFYLSSEEVSYQEFQRFTQPFLKKNKIIKALEWAPKVLDSEKQFYYRKMKQEEFTHDFQLTELDSLGKIIAVQKRPFYYPVSYLNPLITNELVFGFDLMSEEKRKKTILQCIKEQKAIVSDPIKLIQNTSKNSYGLLVCEAIQKQNKIEGVVVAVYDLNDLFAYKIIKSNIDQIDFSLYIKGKLIYQNTLKNKSNNKKFSVTQQIKFANQDWKLVLSPNKIFFADKYSWTSSIVILLILLIGASIFTIFYLNIIRSLITEQKVEEKTRSLKLSNHELEQFAYITSHDLQEPLYTLKSYIGLFQDMYHKELDEQGVTFLGFALKATDRMQEMLHELLIFSSLGRQTEFREIDTNLLLKIVLDEFDDFFIKEAVQINKEYLPKIFGDFVELKKLFSYIINNSIKFRNKERNLILSIFVESIKNNFVTISIKDNGIGILEDHFEKIFIIFQRLHTRNEYEGNGIGLAICKKVVSLHGGEISIQSELAQGTTITFTLPII